MAETLASAQEAGPSGQQQRPSTTGRKPWRHVYYEKLDRFYTLDGALGSRNTQGGMDNREEWSKLKLELEALEKKHKITKRWQPDSHEYTVAARERKAYELARLERAASGLAATLAGLQDRLYRRGSLALTKKECNKLSRGCSAAKASLLSVLGQMRRWLGYITVVPWVTYSVPAVDAVIASLEGEAAVPVVETAGKADRQAGGAGIPRAPARVHLPWEGDEVMSWEVSVADDLAQRWLRCNEECTIVERELRDMVIYYTRKISLLRAQREVIRGHIAVLQQDAGGGGNGQQQGEMHGQQDAVEAALQHAFNGHQIYLQQRQYTPVGLAREACTVLAGKAVVTEEEVVRLQKLLDAAASTQAKACVMLGRSAIVLEAGHPETEVSDEGQSSGDEEEPIALDEVFEVGEEPLDVEEDVVP
ncbi:hypothetical protein VOLCADRAFT_107384 [Volvox carteri f. nagariensis]|uniref:Uncharacterized protein n=1 Tax=Volvox carteri f. nagariensis TaxID=3068 RepID=D8UDN7_VOLCA|nr:uncharacterized protein VOLCADRAFT_107384 [Volvox carteri f. nagariensis]EFJ42129.1 hypothetical protein VOLCADRAFT_107384 [Volvox carteri f. nagariensis]|eukprot:XP_002956826.1 hypothetical protein VOLCADRAFT_107384 [Volvox carteri f. nagariensis]